MGVLGNLATCLVIMRNEYMRTTTNIYLLNLAVADLATLMFAMPVELYLMWRQYPWTLGEVRLNCTTKKSSLRTFSTFAAMTLIKELIKYFFNLSHFYSFCPLQSIQSTEQSLRKYKKHREETNHLTA